MSLIFAQRGTLEPNVLQEIDARSADEHFDGLVVIPSDLSFPHMPASSQDLVDLVLLELDADEELGRIVHFGVDANEESRLQVDTADIPWCTGRKRPATAVVLRRRTILLRSVLDLEAVLIGGPIFVGVNVARKAYAMIPMRSPAEVSNAMRNGACVAGVWRMMVQPCDSNASIMKRSSGSRSRALTL